MDDQEAENIPFCKDEGQTHKSGYTFGAFNYIIITLYRGQHLTAVVKN